ncbi:restriction endonuclease subunit S [Burkholderia ambifaria]|uniref:restriction endonuclease subunit S n=1 Tax=Burkholderia ambifaria TaxID=152480 RepID=UPI003C7A5AA8
MLRAKNFLREIDDRTKTGEEALLSMRQHRGLVPHNDVSVKRITPENLIGYKKAQPDELVLNRMQAGNAMFFCNRLSGLVSPDYAVFRLLRDDSPEYLGYLFRSWPIRGLFRSESKGLGTGTSGFLRLYSDRFAALEIPLPPRPEQDQIVAYLQAQDAHIGRLIKTKRDLIGLLTEQKLRIIDHAVTRGLDASVALRPSGIEWLGDIPEHWEVSKVKLLADYINGFPFKPAEWGGKGRPIIRIQNLTKEHAAFNYYDGVIPERNHVKDGDILLSWSASLGVFVWNRGDAWLNQHIFKVIPDPKRITRGYFVWLARWFLNHMEAEAHGSTMQHITKPKFGSFPVPLPSLKEQVEIEEHLQKETQDIHLAIARAEEEIKLIREYRDRQIADVVTGQVDVRGWRPGPDDVVAEEDLAVLGGEEIDTEGEDDDGDD